MGHCQGFFDETARIAESLDHEKVERMVGELVALRARRGRLPGRFDDDRYDNLRLMKAIQAA